MLPRWRIGLRPRIRIITAFDAAIACYGEIAAANLASYAQRHGYSLSVFRDGFDPSRPPAWSKILFTLRAMRGADWVVWVDADIMIMDHRRTLTPWLSESHDFVIARHHAPHAHANTGFFFARSRLWVRGFLRHVYSQTHVLHHGWWEQIALNLVLERYRFKRVCFVDEARAFNALYSSKAAEDVYKPGDFLVHLAGLPHKLELMRHLGAHVERGP